MADTKRTFTAEEVLKQPYVLDGHPTPYVMIYDSSMNLTFNKLFDCMEMLRQSRRWRVLNTGSLTDYTLYVLYERADDWER